MTIQDVEYIQELERRISELECNSFDNCQWFSIILLVFSFAILFGAIACIIILFNWISKYIDG